MPVRKFVGKAQTRENVEPSIPFLLLTSLMQRACHKSRLQVPHLRCGIDPLSSINVLSPTLEFAFRHESHSKHPVDISCEAAPGSIESIKWICLLQSPADSLLTLLYKNTWRFLSHVGISLVGIISLVGSHATTLRTRCPPRTHAGVDHFYAPAHSSQRLS